MSRVASLSRLAFLASIGALGLLTGLAFRGPLRASLGVFVPRRLASDVASRLTVSVAGRLGCGEPTPIAPVFDGQVFGDLDIVFGDPRLR